MSEDTWTIKAALDWCRGYLERKGDENPRLSAEWLLGEACGMRRVELYVNFDRPLSAEERATLRDWVARRGAGEPLQYITGEVAFRHIAVKVRPGVLIPRPETEVLVSEALSLLPAPQRQHATDSQLTADEALEIEARKAAQELAVQSGETPEAAQADGEAPSAEAPEAPEERDEELLYVADICTGSGCIACSIAYEHPQTRVLACDIDAGAVALAKENVAALGLSKRIAVLQGDLGQPVQDRFMGKLSLVVSNPPYIPTQVMAQLPAEVANNEPALALDGGEDGLDLFRPLTRWAAVALAPDGGFAVELHETCLDAAAAIAQAEGFIDARIVADLAGRPRVLTARKPA